MNAPWTLDTDTGTYTATGLVGDTPTRTPGTDETVRYRVDADYDALRELCEESGAASTWTTQTGKPRYQEQQSGPSLVIGFEPGPDVRIEGFWGLVTDWTDQSNATGTVHELELSVFMLAELSAYATRSDVEAAFANQVI